MNETIDASARKPLGRKNYGSIGHLPCSRLGPGDHSVHEGQGIICTTRARKGDRIIVTEKLDGSNVGVARVGEEIVAIGRSGYRAITSPHKQHHMFDAWVVENRDRFEWLDHGQRVCGEWLAQAHGTRYELRHDPFVIFDLMRGPERAPWDEVVAVAERCELPSPFLVSDGGPITVQAALDKVGEFGHHGALDQIEGVVYRVERDGSFDFMAKYVRPDKVDGSLLPEESGMGPVWNWTLDGVAI